MKLKRHHEAWLSAHANRNAEWLAERLRDGFDVHHLDGDHENNDPDNLVLIDGADHMMLHNGKTRMSRLVRKPKTQFAEAASVLGAVAAVRDQAERPERLPNGMMANYGFRYRG